MHADATRAAGSSRTHRLHIVPLFRSRAPNQIFLYSTSEEAPDHFLALGFRQFVERVNAPGSLSGLVGRMTARGRLDRLDGSTSHPMLHLGVLRDRIPFLSCEPKTDRHLRHRKLSAPKRGSHGPSLGSESYPSRQASEGKKSKRFRRRREPSGLVLLCYKQSEASSTAKRTTRQLFEQSPGDFDANCSDGIWMMTLSAYAANRGVQTGTEVSRCVAPVDRIVQRGKNDFFPQRGSRRRRYITWRDDEF